MNMTMTGCDDSCARVRGWSSTTATAITATTAATATAIALGAMDSSDSIGSGGKWSNLQISSDESASSSRGEEDQSLPCRQKRPTEEMSPPEVSARRKKDKDDGNNNDEEEQQRPPPRMVSIGDRNSVRPKRHSSVLPKEEKRDSRRKPSSKKKPSARADSVSDRKPHRRDKPHKLNRGPIDDERVERREKFVDEKRGERREKVVDERVERKERADERAERRQKGEKVAHERVERRERADERAERREKGEKASNERVERRERFDERIERREKDGRIERREKDERIERREKGERVNERVERREKIHEHKERREKGEKAVERIEKREKGEKSNECIEKREKVDERVERREKGEKVDERIERREKVDERTERREKRVHTLEGDQKTRWSNVDNASFVDYHKSKEQRRDYEHHSRILRTVERSRDSRGEEDTDSHRQIVSHKRHDISQCSRERSKSPSPSVKDKQERTRLTLTSYNTRSPSPSHKDKQERPRNDGEKRYKRSGLGGYSPRRRLSEAAVKTPSPPYRSPERKKARAWDLPPPGDMIVAMVQQQQATTISSVTPFIPVNPIVTAATLTQATRPVRRVYIGNVPSTVLDGELLEFINAAMLSANVNYLPGTKPCISCTVDAEKNYAFAEFLTPEDTSAALVFDGIALHGTTLKIRRPKDYIPPIKGVVETPTNSLISSVVVDSPWKVFVGNICPYLSADEVKEIVTSFGRLKAYHWEVKIRKGRKEAFAFLEYFDPSVTFKACTGLKGMRLGSRILTAVQATPDSVPEDQNAKVPLYDIPEEAMPLLEPPSRVLEFQNLVSKEEVLDMTDSELDEIQEDVRLECMRFGTVRSTHMVKQEKHISNLSMLIENSNNEATRESSQQAEVSVSMEVPNNEGMQGVSSSASDEESGLIQHQNQCDVNINDISEVGNEGRQETVMNGCLPTSPVEIKDLECAQFQDELIQTIASNKSPLTDIGDQSKRVEDEGNTETLGRVYVEFSREELSCQAAHALHGRLFRDRKAIINYYPLKLYQKRFHKGLGPRSLIERQALAVATQEHLHIIEREQASSDLLTIS